MEDSGKLSSKKWLTFKKHSKKFVILTHHQKNSKNCYLTFTKETPDTKYRSKILKDFNITTGQELTEIHNATDVISLADVF